MSSSPSFFRPRNLIFALGAILLAIGGYFASSDEARRGAELRAAEVAGDLATRVVAARAGEDGGGHSSEFIKIPIEVRKLGDAIYQARGVGNTHVIATSEGHVVFDTGLATQAAKQRRLLGEALPEGPITHVILSHSHQDHAGGAPFWISDGTEVIAHAEYDEEQRYLKELEDYLWFRNRTLFTWMPESPPKTGMFAYGGTHPTRVVDQPNTLEFEQGGIQFVVLPTPGAEGADNLCLWLPEEKVLFSGDFFGPNFPQFPNIFTMRGEKMRKPVEYIASLNQIIELEPEMVVPSHQDPIVGKEEILVSLIKMRDATKYVHDATIAGMNAGKSVHQLMEEIVLPPELELTQIHGKVSWAVKSIWEYYATWFHFDSTTELYSVPRSSVEPEIAALAGVDALAEKANEHIAQGNHLHAIHLLEVALAGDPGHRPSLLARKEALSNLLDQAKSTFNNSYELEWLNYRIRITDEALAAN